MNTFTIANYPIGHGHPCFIIAEVGMAHDGSLGTAHAYIDAIAKTGANAVKFQTHYAEEESTPGEPFRVPCFVQDETRYGYWQRTQFTYEQWAELARHAESCGLVFLSTPFSSFAISTLRTLVPAWKVGSGEVTNLTLLEEMGTTGNPVILSSGMATWSELDQAVGVIRNAGSQVALLQCTTAYPCKAEHTGLNVLDEMRERYGVPVGLSCHAGEVFPSYAAVALGANLLEVHVTLSTHSFGPDVVASITIEQLTELVRGVRFIERALTPVDKDESAGYLTDLKQAFGKSIVATWDMPVGWVIRRDDVALKKPGTGIPASRLKEVVGRQLRMGVKAGSLLTEEHV